MTGHKSWFGSIFSGARRKKPPAGPQARSSAASSGSVPLPAPLVVGQYQKGDRIGGKYEVYGVLGRGGFGLVYLVYSHETHEVYALKTFRDEYLADPQARQRFRQEAQVWIALDRHPYLLRACFVEELAGRLYIATEYIAPDERGLNTLEAYLTRRPPDLAQSLRWAIQVCYGMEHAYSKGLRCHRDLKPSNILTSQDRTVKIADFGLGGALGRAEQAPAIALHVADGRVGLSGMTLERAAFGTPTHMPPEQFTDAASCDGRSDIYAFGVVLYQMASGGQLPFLARPPRDGSPAEQDRFWREMQRLQATAPVPRMDSPLDPIIQRCLAKEPTQRYQRFGELRGELEPLLRARTGEIIGPPAVGELEAWEWNNKGTSLAALGRRGEAIACHDRALAINPNDQLAWYNKGAGLIAIGRSEEALACFDRALALDPEFALAWHSQGAALYGLGRYAEALACFDRALALDPEFALAWLNQGNSLASLGRLEEAAQSYERFIAFAPAQYAADVEGVRQLIPVFRSSAQVYLVTDSGAAPPRTRRNAGRV